MHCGFGVVTKMHPTVGLSTTHTILSTEKHYFADVSVDDDHSDQGDVNFDYNKLRYAATKIGPNERH